MNSYDIFGYIGTLLVLTSFSVNNVIKLRIINTLGAIFWILYGISTSATPTIVANLAVVLVHSYWLIKQKIWK